MGRTYKFDRKARNVRSFQRKFGGKLFKPYVECSKKSVAESWKEKAKKRGKKTRVVKEGSVYVVYTR